MEKLPKKTFHDLMKLCRDTPEYGQAYYEHFEGIRDSLLADSWMKANPYYEKKCQHVAQWIQAEILDASGFRDLSRKG